MTRRNRGERIKSIEKFHITKKRVKGRKARVTKKWVENETLDRAIEALAREIVQAQGAQGGLVAPDESLKFTQAALNLAHVKSFYLTEEKERKTKGAGA